MLLSAFFISLLLSYGWFTMLCSFLLYSKVIQFYICLLFKILLSILIYHRILNIVLCAMQ